MVGLARGHLLRGGLGDQPAALGLPTADLDPSPVDCRLGGSGGPCHCGARLGSWMELVCSLRAHRAAHAITCGLELGRWRLVQPVDCRRLGR